MKRIRCLAVVIALASACADFPLNPRIDPPFWSTTSRPVTFVAQALPKPGFAPSGDEQTFDTFRFDDDVVRALACAEAHRIDVTSLQKRAANVLESRGFRATSDGAQAQITAGKLLGDVPPNDLPAIEAPSPDPTSNAYILAMAVRWWGFSRRYFLVVKEPLYARVVVEYALFDARNGTHLWSVMSYAEARVGDDEEFCSGVSAALHLAQTRATEDAVRQFSQWSGQHRVRLVREVR